MSTDYNPDGRKDNCGFVPSPEGFICSRALFLLLPINSMTTLQRLNLEREGGKDPLHRGGPALVSGSELVGTSVGR